MASAPQSQLPLFYNALEPLSSETHANFKLRQLDRATFLAEPKSVYEALYPETKHGDNNRFLPSGQNGHLGVPRYSAEVAERLGLGERTVRRSVKLYQSLHIDARRRLTGTWLADHGQQLD